MYAGLQCYSTVKHQRNSLEAGSEIISITSQDIHVIELHFNSAVKVLANRSVLPLHAFGCTAFERDFFVGIMMWVPMLPLVSFLDIHTQVSNYTEYAFFELG